MISIAFILGRVRKLSAKYNRLDRIKELVNIKAIDTARAAGEGLLYIKEVLSSATLKNPIETDLGWFTSFRDFLNKSELNVSSAYRYIKLAENWDIVLKLGMQDESTSERSMRLCRTLKVIDWYNKRVKEGVDPSLLDLDRYWLEQEKPIEKPAHTVKELLVELAAARAELSTTRQQADRYKEQYEQLKLQFETYLGNVAPSASFNYYTVPPKATGSL